VMCHQIWSGRFFVLTAPMTGFRCIRAAAATGIPGKKIAFLN